MPDPLTPIFQAALDFPLLPMGVLLLALWIFGENYPFSRFPMYSSFARHSFVVYVVGSDGKPVPVEKITSIRTGKLKKIFKTRLEQSQRSALPPGARPPGYHQAEPHAMQAAAGATLAWLRQNCKPSSRPELERHGPLALFGLRLALKDGRIMETHQELGREGASL